MWQVVHAGWPMANAGWEPGWHLIAPVTHTAHCTPRRPPAALIGCSLCTHVHAPLSPQAAAELVLSPDGRFLYASNRGSQGGHNSIAVFGVCPSSGRLAPLAWETGGGAVDFPRHMSLAAGGSLMLVRLGLCLGGRQGTGPLDAGGFGFGQLQATLRGQGTAGQVGERRASCPCRQAPCQPARS